MVFSVVGCDDGCNGIKSNAGGRIINAPGGIGNGVAVCATVVQFDKAARDNAGCQQNNLTAGMDLLAGLG